MAEQKTWYQKFENSAHRWNKFLHIKSSIAGWQGWLAEFILFGAKQAWACIFGALLLGVMITTHYWYPIETIHRYDFLFVFAIVIQVCLIYFRFETWKEVCVIFLFHIVATGMELFKTSSHIGSWSYPEESYLCILTVPLFAGFLYSAVGSYIARVWKVFHFRFEYHPPLWASSILALLIYINFFTHHYIFDIRLGLFIATVVLYGRTRIYFRIANNDRYMPLLLGFFLVALFIWMGENIGTFTNTWLYPHQTTQWRWVSFGKMGAWFLLMIISFVMVSWLHRKTVTAHTYLVFTKPGPVISVTRLPTYDIR